MVVSLYMAEAGLLAGLELVVRLVLVLVHVLREVRSQGRQEWMRKIGVDHNTTGWAGIGCTAGAGAGACTAGGAVVGATGMDEKNWGGS